MLDWVCYLTVISARFLCMAQPHRDMIVNRDGGMIMWEDHIVKEVRETREALFTEWDEDLDKLFQHLKKQGKEKGRRYRSFPRKTATPDFPEVAS